MNKKSVNVKIGDSVQFRYRHDSSVILIGSVVNVLTNTIIVDVSDSSNKIPGLENRQLVKLGQFKKNCKQDLFLAQ
ncbi:methyltransferase [Bacillus sp. TH22]|uniref:Methyltransferase n=1 Tax=Bacillus cereus TaxID=1396 RepID=A0A1S9T3P5_BACCE|nr:MULTISPECIES: methyltransferase [Bacillus]MBK5424280.1 methyltransferase [Bacillus sp. TH30]MBK5452415.1 methyltransferase [Bacillus sp. TH22]MBK5457669.1 methyltransferase [Bacillus sp. TH23]MBK5469113.1 methyltransferase [Bacillus sp. TH19]MED1380995.1 methyltransferase [Bacillus mycoides]